MNRTQTRESAFKLIYSAQIQKDMEEDQIDIFCEQNEISKKEEITYIKETFNGIKNNIDEINELISKNLKQNWEMNRISKIDISILKLAIYELIYTKLPFKVVINEAVELAKKYGDDSSKSFVNGILASVVKDQDLA